MSDYFSAPDYSKYTLERLIQARKHLNVERYPERAKELEQLIAKLQEQSDAGETSTQEIIWLKKPESKGQQNFWLYASVTIIVLLPFFFTGNDVPSYSLLHSYYGEYHGIRQTYNRNGVVLYDLRVGDREFQVAGAWQKLLTLEPGTNVRVLSAAGHKVWEIRSGDLAVVAYSDFVQYADKQKSNKKKQALFFLIGAVFMLLLYFKLRHHNKSLQPKAPREEQED